jgi:undecaprenyl-diphosphatase
MTIWEAMLLGVIQGLTEFLPISSTAHLLFARTLMGHKNPEDAFTVVIQLGTLVAVFAYFRGDIVRLAKGWFADLRARKVGSNADGRMAWLIVLGSVPVVVVGFVLKSWLKATFFNLPALAVVAVVFALLMLAAEVYAKRRSASPREEGDVGWRDALWVGVWQALALMPGG